MSILNTLYNGPTDDIEVLRRLDSDEDYYGAYGRQWISNSNIGALLNNPKEFGKPTEESTPLLLGGYFHHVVLEPEKALLWETIDVSSRNTKAYKEAAAEKGKMIMLEKERIKMNQLADTMMSVPDIRDMLDDSIKEVPRITYIDGVPFKGKADAVNEKLGIIIDVKTSSDIDGFQYSAQKWGYTSQAYIYKELFGLDMVFVVVDKNTGKLGMFDCAESFYEKGRDRVEKAIEMLRTMSAPGFNLDEYYIRRILY